MLTDSQSRIHLKVSAIGLQAPLSTLWISIYCSPLAYQGPVKSAFLMLPEHTSTFPPHNAGSSTWDTPYGSLPQFSQVAAQLLTSL